MTIFAMMPCRTMRRRLASGSECLHIRAMPGVLKVADVKQAETDSHRFGFNANSIRTGRQWGLMVGIGMVGTRMGRERWKAK